MISIDPRSRTPIYQQIQNSIEALILSGFFLPDDQLPGVRTLAGDLAINPNTIQKAYHNLESDGITYSLPGRGSFVAVSAEHLRKQREPQIFATFGDALTNLWRLHIPEADVQSYVHHHYHQYVTKGGGLDD